MPNYNLHDFNFCFLQKKKLITLSTIVKFLFDKLFNMHSIKLKLKS